MNAETTGSEGVAEQVEKPVVAGKKGAAKDVDLFIQTAKEIDGLSKTAALKRADQLAEDADQNFFTLGGVLKRIYDQSWFEGHETFAAYVFEKFGFRERTAKYHMSIFSALVEKQIPYVKVAKLRWTKLKEIALLPEFTAETVDEWVAKVEKLTTLELQALIAAGKTGSGDPAEKTKPTDEIVKLTFKTHKDQAETITSALSKGKAALNTDADTVALAAICTNYLADGAVAGPEALKAAATSLGLEASLEIISELFPEYDISVAPAEATA
jgi:hypothetical protein